MSRCRVAVVRFDFRNASKCLRRGKENVFVHNSAITGELYKTREPGDVDISQRRQGLQAASVTRPVPREYGKTINEARQAEYCSLGTVLLVDSDCATSSTRSHLLSACKVTMAHVTGYAEASSSARPATYDVVAISMKAGFKEVRNTAVHVRNHSQIQRYCYWESPRWISTILCVTISSIRLFIPLPGPQCAAGLDTCSSSPSKLIPKVIESQLFRLYKEPDSDRNLLIAS